MHPTAPNCNNQTRHHNSPSSRGASVLRRCLLKALYKSCDCSTSIAGWLSRDTLNRTRGISRSMGTGSGALVATAAAMVLNLQSREGSISPPKLFGVVGCVGRCIECSVISATVLATSASIASRLAVWSAAACGEAFSTGSLPMET